MSERQPPTGWLPAGVTAHGQAPYKGGHPRPSPLQGQLVYLQGRPLMTGVACRGGHMWAQPCGQVAHEHPWRHHLWASRLPPIRAAPAVIVPMSGPPESQVVARGGVARPQGGCQRAEVAVEVVQHRRLCKIGGTTTRIRVPSFFSFVIGPVCPKVRRGRSVKVSAGPTMSWWVIAMQGDALRIQRNQ
ncbi:hypothetical protein GW17_00029224 [Ensete ventricosum]|nr:hypothetical protein GW17_00029224 [Ensete ventricosum]